METETKKPWLTVTLKDCRVDTFRSGGPGGQHQNKTSSGVRIVHEPSGAVGESREHRSQLQNKKAAFRRMVDDPRFMLWVKLQGGREAKIKAEVDRLLEDRYIRTEVHDDKGRWVPTELTQLT